MAQGGFSERTQEAAIQARSGLTDQPGLFDGALKSLKRKGVVASSKKGRGRTFIRISQNHKGLIQKYSIRATKRK